MACTTGQTSAILDCICVNGVSLIDYIDGGDQALQTCCTANGATLAALQAAVTALQALAHPPLTLTKVQDVTNRATLNLATQVLNLPPAIAGRIIGVNLAAPVGLNQPAQIVGLAADFDTVGGTMALADHLVIPRRGRYNISASWGTAVMGVCPSYLLTATLGINGVWSGRYTAPSNALADQVAWTLPGQLLQAGDLLTLGAYSDCAGVVATSAYLAAEYIEGS